MKRIELLTFATSYGTGPYHPALQTCSRVMYWPNITFENEDAAVSYAQNALDGATQGVEEYADVWNIYTV